METYEILDNVEQIRTRPEMWIGDTKVVEEPRWYLSDSGTFKFDKCVVSQAHLKLFEELLNNARDNYIRYPNESPIYKIGVSIDYSTNEISIINNGKAISNITFGESRKLVNKPLRKTEEQYKDSYCSVVLFGSLYSSSNYRDSYGGTNSKNGIGAYICNIFSSKFNVETADGNTLLSTSYSKGKLLNIKKPIKCAKKYTKISYIIEPEEFGANDLSNTFDIMARRSIEVASYIGAELSLNLNGLDVPFSKVYKVRAKSSLFALYESCFKPIIYETEGASIAFFKKNEDQVNFDMNICNVNGNVCDGKNVDYITSNLLKCFGGKINASIIKSHIFIASDLYVHSPLHDNQAKNKCTNKFSDFPEIDLTNVSKKIMSEWNFKDILDKAEITKLDKEAKKLATRQKVIDVDNFVDANRNAKTKNLDKSLFIVEGLSAMYLPSVGIRSVPSGSDIYGSYPLTGKPLNLIKASEQQFLSNKVVSDIVKIIGLDPRKQYTKADIKYLRFQSVIIAADADVDGISICGLIIAMIYSHWPSLLEIGFIKRFITPIVKVGDVMYFSELEFEKDFNSGKYGNTKCRYFKGLGSLEKKDIESYFANLNDYVKPITYNQIRDEDALLKAYATGREFDRKVWINSIPEPYDPFKVDEIKINDFIENDLITYSQASTIRAIPSIADGLKNVQRKILYWALSNRTLDCSIDDAPKVMEIMGQISSKMHYHHGDSSLSSAIVFMAQDFAGTNNYPYLVPIDNFGTRFHGRTAHAAPRYIHTKLSNATRKIFRKEDLDPAIVPRQLDDGTVVEPRFLIPIIPTILLNDINGIATGYRSRIPAFFTIEELCDICIKYVDSEGKKEKEIIKDLIPAVPYYKGFTGSFESYGSGFLCRGVMNFINDKQIQITEVPISISVNEYEEILKKKRQIGLIDSFDKHHEGDNINFIVTLSQEYADSLPVNDEEALDQLYVDLSLEESIPQHLTILDDEQKVHVYRNISELFSIWVRKREYCYKLRKNNELNKLYVELLKLINKRNFIRAMIGKKNLSKQEIIDHIKTLNPHVIDDKSILNVKKYLLFKNINILFDPKSNNYDSLLNVPMYQVTVESGIKLDREIIDLTKKIEEYEKSSIYKIWKDDLLDLQSAIAN